MLDKHFQKWVGRIHDLAEGIPSESWTRVQPSTGTRVLIGNVTANEKSGRSYPFVITVFEYRMEAKDPPSYCGHLRSETVSSESHVLTSEDCQKIFKRFYGA